MRRIINFFKKVRVHLSIGRGTWVAFFIKIFLYAWFFELRRDYVLFFFLWKWINLIRFIFSVFFIILFLLYYPIFEFLTLMCRCLGDFDVDQNTLWFGLQLPIVWLEFVVEVFLFLSKHSCTKLRVIFFLFLVHGRLRCFLGLVHCQQLFSFCCGIFWGWLFHVKFEKLSPLSCALFGC